MLRCPRCGAKSPASAGKCVSCGLEMYTKRRAEKLGPDAPPARFLTGRARKMRQRANGSRRRAGDFTESNEAGKRFNDDDLMPKRPANKEGEMPVASGLTAFYDLGDKKGPVKADQPEQPEPNGEITLDGQEKKAQKEPPKGGEVEVGTMAEFLMDPSDNPHELQEESAKYFGGGDSELTLDLAPRQFGDAGADAPAGNKFEAKKRPQPEREERVRPEPEFPDVVDEFETEPKKPEEQRSTWSIRGRFLLKWAAPQLVLLLILLVAGPRYIDRHYILDGTYEAVFSDDTGRKVVCRTAFEPEGYKLTGSFKCKLYPNDYSTKRVDEPKVLKPIMGDGNIVYTGHYTGSQLLLTLGTMDEQDTRSVKLVAKFKPNIEEFSGVTSNPLGHSGLVKMEKRELEED